MNQAPKTLNLNLPKLICDGCSDVVPHQGSPAKRVTHSGFLRRIDLMWEIVAPWFVEVTIEWALS